MSRVGKMPVTIPAGVDVSVKDDQISVKGSGGTLSLAQNVLVKVSSNDGKLSFEPANDSREANAMSGTIRQLVNNMVLGAARASKRNSACRRGLQLRFGFQAEPAVAIRIRSTSKCPAASGSYPDPLKSWSRWIVQASVLRSLRDS